MMRDHFAHVQYGYISMGMWDSNSTWLKEINVLRITGFLDFLAVTL
jgi:hypothetical protein